MRTTPLRAIQRTRLDLALLLLASLGLVAALATGLQDTSIKEATSLGVERLTLFVMVAAAALVAAILVVRELLSARRAAKAAREESARLRAELATAQSITQAEPHILIYWEPQKPLRIVTHSLTGVPGLPEDGAELLRFGLWLEPRSAEQLKAALDRLFLDGTAFSIIVKTRAGGTLEADGRASGGRAVFRLRDVASYRQELAHIVQHHQRLAGDIRASRALIDALPMPAWIRGANSRLAWVNSAYVAAVEAHGAEEVVERQIELLESRQRKAVERQLAKGEGYRERMHLSLGGERKAHDVLVLPVEQGTVGAALDVTALEVAQVELNRQTAAYDRTLDRLSTAVAIFSSEQRLTFFNEAFAALWQLDADWLRKMPTDGAVLDRLRERGRLPEVQNYRDWKARVLSCYATGLEYHDDWHLPDGRTLHVSAEHRPDGGVTYLYADETERLALATNYNALMNVQRETLDSLKEGVAVFGTDGRLKLSNSAFQRIWKLAPGALAINSHVDEFIRQAGALYQNGSDWAEIRRTITAFSDAREEIQGQMLRPDQSVIDFASTALPDGGTLLTFADVTVAKRYERALVEKNEALVVADRLKSQFIGHVSYELRTPLTNIIGFSELLSSPYIGQLNAKQLEYLSDITSSSKTLLAIIDDILDLATMDAGTLELKLGPVSVHNVIRSAIQGIHDRALRANLTLDIAVADDATGFIGDEQRIRQVLYNLLSNAVGFSKTGGTVHLTCWREGGAMLFSIEDEGVGIPKDQQRRIFERFESLSQGSKHRGAGLGLSLAKKLVELHGGTLTLDSEPGKGTCVTISLPERGAGLLPADMEGRQPAVATYPGP